MQLVLVGPPGSGKGTQADLLTERLHLRYIGTGDLLREAIAHGTPTGKIAKPLLDVGKLVPDDLVNALIEDLFSSEHRPMDFVLDGYPRTHSQAVWFSRFMCGIGMKLTAVVQFAIDDEEVVRRIVGRRVCPSCGAVYHISDRPAVKTGVCDKCGSDLVQRPDDREVVIRARLQVYHENTDELVDHYRQAGLLLEVPSRASVESIYTTIIEKLSNLKA